MFFKVVIFIAICAVNSRNLLPKLKSEQEIPVLRNNELVVIPIIYKYAKHNHHTLSAPKSIIRSGRSAQPNAFQELQYAPLYVWKNKNLWKNENEKPDEVNTQFRPATVGPMETFESIQEEKFKRSHKNKTHLEPRPVATSNKAEAATSVSRSPGHNVVYKILPESVPTVHERNPIQMVDYVKPIGINLNLESLTSTIAPLVPLGNVDMHLGLSKQQFVMSPIEHLVLNPTTIKNKRYLHHPKYHRLHLNIARVYSPGQLPQQRPPLRVREEYLSRMRGGGKYAQAYVPQDYKALSLAHNTMLYPVKHHRKSKFAKHLV